MYTGCTASQNTGDKFCPFRHDVAFCKITLDTYLYFTLFTYVSLCDFDELIAHL